MSELQLLFWSVQAVIIFVILFLVLLIVFWIVNRWILKGKIRLLYRILLAIGIPLALIGYDYYSIVHSFYSSSIMDERLENIGVGIKLPPYEITEYKNENVIADDFRDTYQMVFKDTSIKSMLPTLDSLCAPWRGAFGGKIYRSNGSHGCLNLPTSKAASLYNMVSIDTPVIVYRS